MIAKIQREIHSLKKQTRSYCQGLSPSQRKRLVLLALQSTRYLLFLYYGTLTKSHHQGEAPAIQHIDNKAIVPTEGNTPKKDSLIFKQLNNGKEHTPSRAKR